MALTHLSTIQSTLFPTLLALLFSSGDAKKGPAEFATRALIISLLFSYLSAAPTPSLPSRAAILLSYLKDPAPAESALPVSFIAEIHRSRPYKLWVSEISNVTKEVFWIFLHNVNIIPYPADAPPGSSYSTTHFPPPRAPVPAAPYVGGVEWEATTYLATHLDLLNGIIAALPTMEERNALRTELRDSGLEKVMGGSLRTCKEKFYGGVHAGLGTWIGAGREDGWDVKNVRQGFPREERRSPRKSPVKKGDGPPVLGEVNVEALPKLQVRNEAVGDWL